MAQPRWVHKRHNDESRVQATPCVDTRVLFYKGVAVARHTILIHFMLDQGMPLYISQLFTYTAVGSYSLHVGSVVEPSCILRADHGQPLLAVRNRRGALREEKERRALNNISSSYCCACIGDFSKGLCTMDVEGCKTGAARDILRRSRAGYTRFTFLWM